MILITTAGKVGAEAARLLAQRGEPVRVLVTTRIIFERHTFSLVNTSPEERVPRLPVHQESNAMTSSGDLQNGFRYPGRFPLL